MDGVGSAIKQHLVILAILSNFAVVQLSLADDAQAEQVKWAQLNQTQQSVLKPLAKEWDTLRPWQRAKMLDIARDYNQMDAKQQARVQQRLTKWSRMTPYEREQARKYHQTFKTLSSENKEALIKQWELYEKLTEAQREELRKAAQSGQVTTQTK